MDRHRVDRGLRGRSALVMGGAAGLGAAIVERLAREGARVAIADIDEEAGAALSARLRELGFCVEFVEADALDEADVVRAVESSTASTALEIAVNVVGGDRAASTGADLPSATLAQWEDTLALSLTSAFLAMKHEIAAMRATGGGVIVNIGSVAGRRVAETSAAYAASKAGIEQLTRWAAVMHGHDRVRVNCVVPGLTLTETVQSNVSPGRLSEIVGRLQVIDRLAVPDDQADAVMWLVSESSAMVTGQVVVVDGGWTVT